MDKAGLVKWFCIVYVFSRFCRGTAKKILIMAPPAGSHFLQANSIAEGLIARGHDVYTAQDVNMKMPSDVLHPKLNVISYDNGVEVIFDTPGYQVPLLSLEIEGKTFFDKLATMGGVVEYLNDECRRILGNEDLFEKLKRENFDFVVVDAFMQCFTIIPDRLRAPFATYLSFLPFATPHAALQGPLLVRGPFDALLSSEATPEILAKLAKILIAYAITDTSVGEFGKYSNKSISELLKESKLWLYDKDRFFDVPIPLSANVITVGGLNAGKPKQLKDGELKRFVDSAEDGFILVSFGSFAQHFPDWITNVFIESFKTIPYKVVWKWNKSALKPEHVVPKNVLVMNWMPQNDVLGHPNIKLFVTHCGNSGQHEALYSGVPMLAIPLFGDQLINAKQITEKGLGLDLRMKYLTKDRLVSAIKTIITDPSFTKNIRKASDIYRNQPMTPKDTAAYWIEHVINYGADHLQSKTNELPWYEILMFDVLFVVCLSIIALCMMLFFMARCLIRCCCGHEQKVKTS